MLAAVVGHDYDAAGSTQGQGVEGMALSTAVLAVAAAKVACAPRADRGDDLGYARRIFEHVLGNHTKARVGGDTDRLLFVVFGFLHHPVLNLQTNRAQPFTPVQRATQSWLQGVNAGVAEQLAALGEYDESDPYHHVGCKDCGTDPEGAAAHAKDCLEAVEDDFDAGAKSKKMTAEAQPKLSTKVLNEYLQTVTPLDWHKIKDEGLERAHDSAQEIVGTIAITYSTTKNPPEALITTRVKQSQDRSTYKVVARVVLNAAKDNILKIVETACDDACIKRYKGVLCRHRAGELCYLWLNTCTGQAGNPGQRDNYWKGHGMPLVGAEANLVVRATEIHTNRSGQFKAGELVAMEDGADAVEAQACRHASPHDAYPVKREKIRVVCEGMHEVGPANCSALLTLARKYNMPRLVRARDFPGGTVPEPHPVPSPVSAASVEDD